MGRVIVYLGKSESVYPLDGDIIGVDYGAFFCVEHQLSMNLAIGDFDSVNADQLDAISRNAKDVIRLSSHKNLTDSEAVLSYCQKYDEIVFIGGLGGRVDHELINISLMKRDHRIILINTLNHMRILEEGDHLIKKENYEYLSLFPLEASIISLYSVAYPLLHRKVTPDDLYLTSNEICADEALISVEKGTFMMILSRDK